MKRLFLLGSFFISITALSQEIGVNPRPYDLLRREFKPQVQKVDPKAKPKVIPPTKPFQQKATLSHTLPNGNKVYRLPLDNMPCIVPAPQNFNMPIVGVLSPFSRMPGTKPVLPPLIEPNAK